MRVVYVARSGEVAGGNVSLLSLVSGLRDRVDASVVAPAVGAFTRLCEARGVAFSVPSSSVFDWSVPVHTLKGVRWWWSFLRRSKPDLIHVNDAYSMRALAWPAKTLGIPVVCHCRFGVGEQYLRWMFRYVPPPDVVICNSHALKDEVTNAWRTVAPGARQVVIHNGIDLSRFEFRNRVGVDRSPWRVTLVGRLLPVKGIDDFVRMAAKLIDRGLDVCCRIVGGESAEAPGYRQGLQNVVDELNIAHAVEFVGYQPDVRPFLHDSDVLVCASHREPFGRVLIEAMACGVAVVGTSVGGIPEVVENGVTGVLVPPGGAAALADAVERLLRDGGLRREMGEKGRRRVEELFSEEHHCQRVFEVYQEVLKVR